MKIITIHPGNLEQEHICCAIGNDKQNQARANTKKQWLKARFQEDLVFKRLDERGKVFIEYMPIEKVWKPVIGANYMAINCLWVSGQFKGRGLSKQLLNECIGDAKAQGMDGVAVVTSGKVKPFLTDKKFYLKHGFRTVDTDKTGAVIDPKMTLFSYPCRWYYDILRALDYFQNARIAYDSRMDDALEIVLKKRTEAGKWPLQGKHPGQVHFEMERGGKASRWNTLRALRVLKWFGLEAKSG